MESNSHFSPRPRNLSAPHPQVGCGAVQVRAHVAVPKPCRIMPLMPSGAETELQTRLFPPLIPGPGATGVLSAGSREEGQGCGPGSGAGGEPGLGMGSAHTPLPSCLLGPSALGDTAPPAPVRHGQGSSGVAKPFSAVQQALCIESQDNLVTQTPLRRMEFNH